MVDTELIEICKEINAFKDQIKSSAQKIFVALDNPESTLSIDSEMLEIYNALGKIGTISGNTKIASYSKALSDLFYDVNVLCKTKQEAKPAYHKFLNQLCSAPFAVKRKGKKFEITLPPINFESIFKFGG